MDGVLDPTIRELLAGREIPTVSVASVDAARAGGVAELLYSEAIKQGSRFEDDAKFRLVAKQLNSDALRARMTTALGKVWDVHESAGMPLRIFKGPAIASLAYESPEERPSSDIDIFVTANDPTGLERLLLELGVHPVSVRAAVDLALKGAPIHELGASVEGVAVDVHFNPYGLLTPPVDASKLLTAFSAGVLGDVEVELPTPELALLIAVVNLARKGGGHLRAAGDIARILQRAEPLDWNTFAVLSSSEGLDRVASSTVAAVVSDLQLDPALTPFETAKRPTWVPRLGEGDVHLTLRRRGTWIPLRRGGHRLESLRYIARWYLPSHEILDIRRPETHGDARLARLVHHARDAFPNAFDQGQRSHSRVGL